MSADVRVFYCMPTETIARSLRRYSSRSIEGRECEASGYGYHNVNVPLDRVRVPYGTSSADLTDVRAFKDHPLWPTHCSCGYVFTPEDEWQISQDTLYKRHDTGEIIEGVHREPGAIYHTEYLAEGLPLYGHEREGKMQWWRGPDQLVLTCILPDKNSWIIESRCSNCGRPDDNSHRCWVRHGSVLDGSITVDKHGNTCDAGAGSIWSRMPHGWHGHLIQGTLRQC